MDVMCGSLLGMVGLTECRDLWLFVLKSNQASILLLTSSLQHPGHCPSQQHETLSPWQAAGAAPGPPGFLTKHFRAMLVPGRAMPVSCLSQECPEWKESFEIPPLWMRKQLLSSRKCGVCNASSFPGALLISLCCLNLLKAVCFEALADVQTVHANQDQVTVPSRVVQLLSLVAKTKRLCFSQGRR